MGEIVNFPGTDRPIYTLDPTKNESWDSIIDEARISGIALYQYDGKMYELRVEDLDEGTDGQDSLPDSQAPTETG